MVGSNIGIIVIVVMLVIAIAYLLITTRMKSKNNNNLLNEIGQRAATREDLTLTNLSDISLEDTTTTTVRNEKHQFHRQLLRGQYYQHVQRQKRAHPNRRADDVQEEVTQYNINDSDDSRLTLIAKDHAESLEAETIKYDENCLRKYIGYKHFKG